MQKPIVIAHHLMWTVYGSWLPNDPRGSTSHTIASDPIAELGELHFGRKKIQPSARALREFYAKASEVLKYPLLKFSPHEFETIACGLAEGIGKHRYTCYACAIMPDHVHILIRKHKHHAEDMIENLQESSRVQVRSIGLRTPDHPVWTEGGWKVFLDRPDDVRRTIRYIEENPVKWGLPRQHWPLVVLYDGWPLHSGHDPNSPYARRLRGEQ